MAQDRWQSSSDEETGARVKRRRNETKKVGVEDEYVEHLRISTSLKGCRDVHEHYLIRDCIASGSFGSVVRATSQETGNVVAIKSFKKLPELDAEGILLSSMREITALMEIDHPNIVKALEVCTDKYDNIYLILEYAEHELGFLLKNNRAQFSASERKCLLHQILQGIDDLHVSHKLVHRDLKPGNLLYSNNGVVKICDFGCSRVPTTTETFHIGTLWYECPESLLEIKGSGAAPMDIWSLGLIAVEILTGGSPVFCKCKSRIELLEAILHICGVPPEEDWPELYKLAPKGIVTHARGANWHHLFNRSVGGSDPLWLTHHCKHLIQGMLELNPQRRLTASQCLAHPYFKEKPLPQKICYMPKIKDTNTSADARKRYAENDVEGRINPEAYLREQEQRAALG